MPTRQPLDSGSGQEILIQMEGLVKNFGKLEVLKGIDQHIAPGEKVVIIGPSGSGKSTFLRCLNLLERPTEGQILFEGTDITDPKCDINLIRRRMGMVFQQFNLFPHLTVMQNLTLAPIQTGQMSKEAATEKATQLLARVGLLEKAAAKRAEAAQAKTTQTESGYTVTGEGDPAIDALVLARYEAKKAKNFAEADRIRDELKAQGIEIIDTKGGASWKRV